MRMMQQCPYCGRSVAVEVSACPYCGGSLGASGGGPLEEAIAAYAAEGYQVTSRTPASVTMVRPKEAEGGTFVFLLVLALPITLLLFLLHRRPRNRTVVLRVLGSGAVQASGYTLEAMARERHRTLLLAGVSLLIALLVCAAWLFGGALLGRRTGALLP